ncbi:MAG TPA: MBOAT family O-acyltransferase [Sedimentisphaerales bacterium]|nr:MBOAT family O-acyltransferase [Sedimentisphaerales bacterium]HRS10246.1 MBOAT family O-acyltransferase [Sedimentisphaerales bacterium]HRV46952.1 MBOAT family O-acyltransferase [Sedimentisphaerales bacterium]
MLFNSLDFAVFVPVVFVVYWFVLGRRTPWQNLFILAASYVFYGWWDWRFLSLIFISSCVDYFVGLGLGAAVNERTRRLLLLTSITVDLGLLGFFKYYNFFAESFSTAFSLLGYQWDPTTLRIILPVGISFYTFQAMSYSIDVYRRKLEPTRDIVAFLAFVSFFPQLVAGPIERAAHLLPQFHRARVFDYNRAVDGLRQMLCGLFKKVVIADNCARYVNIIFGDYTRYGGSTLLLGAVLFSLQIYGDFSGYSDIAVGTSRLFGFDLSRNFAFPYFSRDVAEFWRRWHISLSTWFRDYVYIPLGGSRGPRPQQVRNVVIVFLVSGLWHGANWTFVVWGAIHAMCLLPLVLLGSRRKNREIVAEGRLRPSWRELAQMVITFALVTTAWVFFRSESLGQAVAYLGRMFSPSLFSVPQVAPRLLAVVIVMFLFVEWCQRSKEHALQFDHVRVPRILRWSAYYLLTFSILLCAGRGQTFIYFQF